jgi:hypothetical protein
MSQQQALEIRDLIDRWCPPQFDHEPVAHRIVRAFLNAIACIDDLRDQQQGKPPIRTDYPDPARPPRQEGS